MAGPLRRWVAVVCLAAGLIGAHGCSGKERDFRTAAAGDGGLAEREQDVDALLPGPPRPAFSRRMHVQPKCLRGLGQAKVVRDECADVGFERVGRRKVNRVEASQDVG